MKKILSLIIGVVVMGAVNFMNISKAYAQDSIMKLIESLEVGEPVCYQNLTIIPVYTSNKIRDHTVYTCLEEALKNRLLEITELEGGYVPQVKITNLSKQHIYIMGGEILTGCKQDRIVGRDVLVGPGSRNLIVPVYCVERGRWSYRSKVFYSKDTLGTYQLRAEAQIARSSSQTTIWNEIAELSKKMNIDSRTNAYQELYDKEEVKEKIASFERKFQSIPQLYDDTVGVIVAVGKKIVSADIFVNPEFFKKMHPKLLKSSALSAISSTEKGSITQEEAAQFLYTLGNKEYKQKLAIGLGEEFSAIDEEVNVNALVYRDVIIHLSAFPHQERIYKREREDERRIPVIR